MMVAHRAFEKRCEQMDKQVGISNSEVHNALCELAWGFGHHPEMNLQKRDQGVARTRGILGHEALEIFYKGIKEERDFDSCAQDALNHIHNLRKKEMLAGEFADPDRLSMLNWLHSILGEYFEYYQNDVVHWEILDVESFHAQEQPGEVDFYLPSRLDLVIYQKSGKFKGETSPVDHKFTYDFWQPYKLVLNSQFPLYILALRASRWAGKPEPVVRRVIVNQIRTRELKDPQNHDLFKRDFQPYSTIKLQNVFKNHMKAALRLAYLKRLPWDEVVEIVHAALGSQACQYCDFKDLCDSYLEENNPENVIAALYKPNSYGYPSLEEIRRER